MSLIVSAKFPQGLDRIFEFASNEYTETVKANLAHEMNNALAQRGRTLWPQDTGYSRDRFMVEDVPRVFEIHVMNSALYAAAVNNRERYPRGSENPNYQAVQRTIQKEWQEIVRRTLAKANQSYVQQTAPRVQALLQEGVLKGLAKAREAEQAAVDDSDLNIVPPPVELPPLQRALPPASV